MEKKSKESGDEGSKAWPTIGLVVAFLWTLTPIFDLDVWFYIEYGRRMFEEGYIPWSDSFLGTTDVLAFHRHANHAWLSYGVCFLFYRAAGIPGLVALMSLLFVAIAGRTYLNCRLAGLSRPWATLLKVLGVWTVRSRFLLRSNLFGDVLMAALLYVLLKQRRKGQEGPFPFVGLGLIFSLWTNVHQGVVLGVAVLGAWMLTNSFSWRIRIQAVVLGAACCFLRPYGWWFPYFYLEHFGNSEAVRGVLEWRPMGTVAAVTHLGPLILLGVGGMYSARRVLARHWGEVLQAAFFFFLAIRSMRAVTEVLPVCVPMVAVLWAGREPEKRFRPLAVVSLAIVLWWAAPSRDLSRLGSLDIQFPEGLIQELPPRHGQIFNSYEFGNFLVFRGKEPFIHGMTALFEEQLLIDFRDVLNRTPRRRDLVASYGVTEMMLHHPTEDDATSLLLDDLYHSPEWHLVWWDDSGLLFSRSEGRDLKAVRPWNRSNAWSDREAAKAQLDQMIDYRPSALALSLRGMLHGEDGEKEEALLKYEQSLELNAFSYQTLFAHGALCFELGNFAAAEQSLSEAAKVAPSSPIIHFNLAILYLRTEQNRKAKRALERTLELDPGFQRARELLFQLP